MFKYIRKIEKTIIISLVVMMVLILALSTIELGILLIRYIISPPIFLLDINKLLEIFGFFLLILIGIEVLETIKIHETYGIGHAIRLEVVLIVALIAIVRRVIIIDVRELSGITLIGIGTIIIALATGYYLVKRGGLKSEPEKEEYIS